MSDNFPDKFKLLPSLDFFNFDFPFGDLDFDFSDLVDWVIFTCVVSSVPTSEIAS